MKNLKSLAIGLCLMPIAASAQTNVKKAFDQLINAKKQDAEIIQNHSLEKNPLTGEKVSQLDTYSFTIAKKQLQLVKNIERAFFNDREEAYQYANGKRDKNDDRPIAIAVGNDTGVTIADKDGTNYVYACFLAPEDTSRTHRYAYAMEWTEAGIEGDYIVGKLIVTYATTMSQRQKQQKPGGTPVLYNGRIYYNNDKKVADPESWFGKFSSYVSSLTKAEDSTRQVIASKIYEHAKAAESLKADKNDKNTARAILKAAFDFGNYDKLTKEYLSRALIYLN